jgi:ATP-binding cassette subfamily B protein
VRTLSRGAQANLAEASSYASELNGAMRTLQAFTNERLATGRFDLGVERAYVAARSSTRARVAHGHRNLSDFFKHRGRVVGWLA